MILVSYILESSSNIHILNGVTYTLSQLCVRIINKQEDITLKRHNNILFH